MEIHSDAFIEGSRRVLDDVIPVIAAIHQRSNRGVIGEVKRRDDIDLVWVGTDNRDHLPEWIYDLICWNIDLE